MALAIAYIVMGEMEMAILALILGRIEDLHNKIKK